MGEILLPGGKFVSVNDKGTFSNIFPITYYDFAVANNIKEIGSKTVDNWINSTIERYENPENIVDIKRFFGIENEEYDVDIMSNNYKVSVMVTSHDTVNKVIVLKVILKFNKKEENENV